VNLPNTQKASLLSPRNSRKIFRFIVLAPSVDRGMNFISALGLKIGENIGTRSAANTPDLFKDLFLTLARVAARGNHCSHFGAGSWYFPYRSGSGNDAGCLIIITQVNTLVSIMSGGRTATHSVN
jgi:hypothetical protein